MKYKQVTQLIAKPPDHVSREENCPQRVFPKGALDSWNTTMYNSKITHTKEKCGNSKKKTTKPNVTGKSCFMKKAQWFTVLVKKLKFLHYCHTFIDRIK